MICFDKEKVCVCVGGGGDLSGRGYVQVVKFLRGFMSML